MNTKTFLKNKNIQTHTPLGIRAKQHLEPTHHVTSGKLPWILGRK